MPECMIQKLNRSLLPQWKICFLSAMPVGFAAHFYKITNWLPNWDSLVFRYDAQNMLKIGRWFLAVVCAPSSFYDLPWLNGLLALVLHAAGAVCICKMLHVRKRVTAALIGAVTVSFPTVTSVMMYNYVADGYALSFLFACLAAAFLTDAKPKYLGAAVLIMLSAAIYQAYISVTVMLLLLHLTDELIWQKASVRSLLLKTAKLLGCGALGLMLYYVVLWLLLKLTGTTLLDYQGISDAAALPFADLRASLYVILHAWPTYFFDFSNGISVFTVLNSAVFALTAVLYAVGIVRQRAYKPFGRLLLLALYIALLPVGTSLLALVNPYVDYHNLMKMGYCVVYLFFIILYERTDFAGIRVRSAAAWLVLALSGALIWNQVVIANVSYHKLQMAYEKSYGTLLRLADRIEQTEGAEKCDTILVLGHLPGSEAYSAYLPPDMTGTTDGYILRYDDETVGQSVVCSALNDYCGKNYRFVYGAEKQALLQNTTVQAMEAWPAKNAVAVTENVIVVKLGEESESK